MRPLPVAQGGCYVGAGGSFNWGEFDQALQGVSGVTDVMIGPVLVAPGAGGRPVL